MDALAVGLYGIFSCTFFLPFLLLSFGQISVQLAGTERRFRQRECVMVFRF